jgi:ribulose bisphosphate carboxylase small subunit
MLLQVQIALDQGGAIPREFRDYTIMKTMKWDEDQLKKASRYWKQCIFDFIQIEQARGG